MAIYGALVCGGAYFDCFCIVANLSSFLETVYNREEYITLSVTGRNIRLSVEIEA